MWLLNTTRAELKYFKSADEVDRGYAILSHVWQEAEESFQDLQTLKSTCSSAGSTRMSPRDLLSPKIRECCKLAQADGYCWLWIDTCCIDKSSSAELSEAINSMFAWYARAEVCYVYLHDVPLSDDPHAPGSAFRTSVWHTRGWTLQELLAPRAVVFLSREWIPMSTKSDAGWAALLEDITGIDVAVLAFDRPLSDVSVARRMSWASRRATRRKEDEAYALMGIFGVHMPTIYGEGAHAFRRLQEEIMKQTPDQSLFAWGRSLPLSTLLSPQSSWLFRRDLPDNVLLAPSPAEFAKVGDVVPSRLERVIAKVQQACSGASLDGRESPVHDPAPHAHSVECPEFAVTSHGVRTRLLVVNFVELTTAVVLAVLMCEDASGSPVALILNGLSVNQNPAGTATSPSDWIPRTTTGPLHVGLRQSMHFYAFQPADQSVVRTTRIPADVDAQRQCTLLGGMYSWKELYIAHCLPHVATDGDSGNQEATEVLVSTETLRMLARYGFKARSSGSCEQMGWDDEPPPLKVPLRTFAALTFFHAGSGEAFTVRLRRRTANWLSATVTILSPSSSTLSISEPQDSAEEDAGRNNAYTSKQFPMNTSFWPHGHSCSFGDVERTVTLTSQRHEAEDGAQCRMEIGLAGSVYEQLRVGGRG